MARGKTLLKLLDDLRAETGRSLNVAHNAGERDSQVHLLQRVQERLWEDFSWPHMLVERQIPVQAGQRYYAMPPDVDIERLSRVDIFTDGCWRPMSWGITADHYTAYNSDLDERAWPPAAWRINENEDVEVWPIPNIDANTTPMDGVMKFTGIRRLNPLIADADRADLDDRLIVLYAAAETLARSGAKDAQLKLATADKLFSRLRSGLTPRRQFKMFGLGEVREDRRWYVHTYRRPI